MHASTSARKHSLSLISGHGAVREEKRREEDGGSGERSGRYWQR